MENSSNSLEALRLISDWGKWLVTIETFAIAILGSLFTSDKVIMPRLAKILGTSAIVCFVISIAAAALLLLTLPEIAQTLQPGGNIWLTSDSVVRHILGLSTQDLALIESFFFGVGVVLSSAVVITVIWSSRTS